MRINRFFHLLIVLIMVVLLTGCWSRNELNELAIVSAIGIDKKGEEYLLTVQVLNPGEIAGRTQSERLSVTSYQAKGRSLFEAIRKLSKKSAKRLYFAHLRLVVIGEEQAEDGISKILDMLSRDHEFRTDFYTVVSKGDTASNMLKILTTLEKSPANKIFTSLEVSHSYWAPTLGIKLDDLISELTSTGDNPVLSGILIEGDRGIGNTLTNVTRIDPAASIIIDHFAVFKGDKLVGWMDVDESKGHNYLTDNVESTVAIEEWNEGNITFELRETKTDLEAKIKNEIPKIIVNLTADVQIGEVQTNIDLLNEDILKQLENKLCKNKIEKMDDALKKAKELKTDIFGFGNVIHREDPKLWAKIEKSWNDEGFVNLDVEFNVETHIRRIGTTNQPFLGEIQGGS